MSTLVSHVGDGDFVQQVEQADLPVFVDFHATWCGPCKQIAPVVEELAEEYNGKVKFVKLDIDQNMDTAVRFSVRGVPTLMVFKNGQAEGTQVGAVGKAQLKALVESVL